MYHHVVLSVNRDSHVHITRITHPSSKYFLHISDLIMSLTKFSDNKIQDFLFPAS